MPGSSAGLLSIHFRIGDRTCSISPLGSIIGSFSACVNYTEYGNGQLFVRGKRPAPNRPQFSLAQKNTATANRGILRSRSSLVNQFKSCPRIDIRQHILSQSPGGKSLQNY